MPAPKPSTTSQRSGPHAVPPPSRKRPPVNARATNATAMITPPSGTKPRSTRGSAPAGRVASFPVTTLPTPMPATNATKSGTTWACVVAPASVANWSTLAWATAPIAQKKTIPAAAAASSGWRARRPRSVQVRASAFQAGGACGAAAASRGRHIAASNPATATPPSNRPVGRPRSQAEASRARGVASATQLPAAVPVSTATSDTSENSPLAPASRAGGTSSGIAPTIDGVITAACVPIAITVPRSSHKPVGSPSHSAPSPRPKPSTAVAATAISTSAALHQRTTVVFECRSASDPASHEKST